MKKRFTRNLLLVGFAILSTGQLLAQKSISDLTEMSDKQWDKLIQTDIVGYYWLEGLVGTKLLDVEQLPKPKKIGIMTLQLYSLSSSSSQKGGDWIYTTTYSPTEEGEAFLVDQLMNKIAPSMKKIFGESDYTLLEPSQFLDTPEKKEIYENGRDGIQASGYLKFLGGKLESGDDEDFEGIVPEGYQFYPISPEKLAMDIKGPGSYGLIAEELGLDGLLILSLMTTTSAKMVTLDNFSAAIVVPINDNKEAEFKGAIGAGRFDDARNGITLTYVNLDVESLPLLKIKKGQFESYYYEKFNLVAERVAKDLVEDLDELQAWEPKGAKKKKK